MTDQNKAGKEVFEKEERDGMMTEIAMLRAETEAIQKKLEEYAEKIADAKRIYSIKNSEIEEERYKLWKDNSNLLKTILAGKNGDEDYDKLADYWVGITNDPDRQELKTLREENQRLKARLKAKQEIIQYLRESIVSLIYGGSKDPLKDTDGSSEPVRLGRPRKSDEGAEEMAVLLRSQGYTIREIANTMGFSIGKVHNIVRGVSVDAEKIKQHRKTRIRKKKDVT